METFPLIYVFTLKRTYDCIKWNHWLSLYWGHHKQQQLWTSCEVYIYLDFKNKIERFFKWHSVSWSNKLFVFWWQHCVDKSFVMLCPMESVLIVPLSHCCSIVAGQAVQTFTTHTYASTQKYIHTQTTLQPKRGTKQSMQNTGVLSLWFKALIMR